MLRVKRSYMSDEVSHNLFEVSYVPNLTIQSFGTLVPFYLVLQDSQRGGGQI